MGKKEKNYYFETFIKSVSYCHDAAEMLRDCFDNYTSIDLPKSIEAMHDIEHAADEIKHEMMNQLVKEFLPPLEREDIVELAHAIDDVTDSIEDVLLGMYMSNTTELREDAKTFAKIIYDCCCGLQKIAAEFHNFRKSALLREIIVEINRLEEDGDRLYVDATRRLYMEETDPIKIFAWSSIYGRLERCCDSCEDVADMVEQIVMKNS